MPKRKKPRLYLAGPLFSEAEKRFNLELAELLSPHLDVYLPQRDGGLLVELLKTGVPLRTAKHRIFSGDMRALKSCTYILIVLDGRSVDEGAAFELGCEYVLGKRCYGYQSDPRRLLPAGNNPMIEGALRKIFTSRAQLLRWAKRRR